MEILRSLIRHRLYELGLEPQLVNLYPAVEYPVSRGTPMISPLVRWDHRDDWFLTSYRMQERIKSGERTIRVAMEDDDWQYIQGHVIDGRNLFPATGYVVRICNPPFHVFVNFWKST